jgi:hypothetical protein
LIRYKGISCTNRNKNLKKGKFINKENAEFFSCRVAAAAMENTPKPQHFTF